MLGVLFIASFAATLALQWRGEPVAARAPPVSRAAPVPVAQRSPPAQPAETTPPLLAHEEPFEDRPAEPRIVLADLTAADDAGIRDEAVALRAALDLEEN